MTLKKNVESIEQIKLKKYFYTFFVQLNENINMNNIQRQRERKEKKINRTYNEKQFADSSDDKPRKNRGESRRKRQTAQP